MATPPPRLYPAAALWKFAVRLLVAARLPEDRADVVADILLEGDLMGHTTHGMHLLPAYLNDLEHGRMSTTGDPVVVRDQGSAVTWDGGYLPGPWLVSKAISLGFSRLDQYPVVTVVIRRSHHIASLASYLKKATDRGLVMVLMCSDPAGRCVAPHGGSTACYTPNPIAVGWPTAGDPILVDISASATTLGLTSRMYREGKGETLPGPWLVDGHGNLTDEPRALFEDPKGAILPLGGAELGHKGFGLGLIVEALTSALGGYGRAEGATNWGASVFLQLINPDSFGDRAAFVRETSWMADACRASVSREGHPPVRLPGSSSLARRERQLRFGVELYPSILDALQTWAEKFSLPMPSAI